MGLRQNEAWLTSGAGNVNLFLSYARPDRPKVDFLAQRLRQAGNSVWLDTDLDGGQVWWDKILYQLRQCDALIAIVSHASLRSSSQACIYERQYAMRLGKAILPVAIEPIGPALLPSDIARLQVVDYSQPSEAAAYQLIGSITRLPPSLPLPNPLPEPPPTPFSYLPLIADRISAPALSMDEQFAIVGRLEATVASSADPADRAAVLELLNEMQGRSDLFVAVDKRIAALRTAVQESQKFSIRRETDVEQRLRDQNRLHQPSRPPTPPSPPPAPPSVVSPHWGRAIAAIMLFFPVGIVAVVFAGKVRPYLAVGDFASAQAYSSRVVVVFWICVTLFSSFMLYLLR
jgi:hypothetical protein